LFFIDYHRFLNEHMLAGIECLHSEFRMRAMAGSYEQGVDGGVLEQWLNVRPAVPEAKSFALLFGVQSRR
jgi:hypothetical protein